MATHVQGVIYLLHFDRPYRHASHYTWEGREFGITEGALAGRRR
jgi:hypothetical protein